ncbi:glycoside hydrolase family 71/99-like protein [Flavobacteriaceae bacterium]|nr:glycoside hydrolase family 71/99-like protein [Flavobacteriaceae bacterium]
MSITFRILILLTFLSAEINSQSLIDNPIGENNSIEGKILAGYQGWFNTKNDGADLGWKHYNNKGVFKQGSVNIDFWPDMTEYSKDHKYKTPFKHSDNKTAYLFSSADYKTVSLHFKWMKEYGIDGVFVQRFSVALTREKKREKNLFKVFDNCFKSAKEHDRVLGVMYDLSGSKSENVVETIKNDWKKLVKKHQLNNPKNPNVLTYKGKTIVSIWGVGFKDGRDYTLEDVSELIDFFKNDPTYGNCSVLLGLPTGWRTLSRDATTDTQLHDIIKSADIVHPWTPGRYSNLESADLHKKTIVDDKKWCDENKLLYMPVVFPGFSWSNQKRNPKLFNQIPRLKGDFLWRQFYNTISSEVKTIYVAMFDEMDEGTCIFKTDNHPPESEKSNFLTNQNLPSDYYLWLTGRAGKMLRKEIPMTKLKPSYSIKINEK